MLQIDFIFELRRGHTEIIKKLNYRFEKGLVWWSSFYAGIKCLGVSGLCINLTGFEAFSFSQVQLMLNYLLPSVGL